MKKTLSAKDVMLFDRQPSGWQCPRASCMAPRAAFGGPAPSPIGAAARAGVKRISLCCAAVALSFLNVWLSADQVEMRNGDRYRGKVLSLDTNSLVLRSDVLGTVRLPRGKVALVTLGENPATNVTRGPLTTDSQRNTPAVAPTNGVVNLSTPLRQLGANTNFIKQIQAQFLADAGPEANNKFNEMVDGLMNGKLTVNDLRAEAKSAVDQLKGLKRDLGDDDSGALDGYLAILENFLQETVPPPPSPTNVLRPVLKGKPAPVPVRKAE